jgi:2-polyprenyl-6-methoxyphenol hydroxylase-like FAD-dependent oxidoreductase
MPSIIIVGAGPVGLVAAMLLDEAGVDCIVLEADETVSSDLRASTFHPPTLDMLEPYGVTEAVVAQGLKCPHWQIRMHETGERVVFDLSVLADETAHPYRLQCEQALLVEHLAIRLQHSACVELRHGCKVVAAGESPGERAGGAWVDVSRDGKTERIHGRYIVGADGADSIIRREMNLEFTGSTHPTVNVLASTPFDFAQAIEGLSNVSYCWHANGNFALLRLNGFWRASLYYDPRVTPEQAASYDAVQRELEAICPGHGPFDIIDSRPYRVHQRLVSTYRRGRLLLAGDAAHINVPTGGMGMNGGIHDAFSLVGALVDVLSGGPEEQLDRYSRQRRTVAEKDILAQAGRNHSRMTQTDDASRRASLQALAAIVDDPVRARAHLRKTSMMDGLDLAASVQ